MKQLMMQPGFSGEKKVDAELVAENLAERMTQSNMSETTKDRLKNRSSFNR